MFKRIVKMEAKCYKQQHLLYLRMRRSFPRGIKVEKNAVLFSLNFIYMSNRVVQKVIK